MSFQEIALNVMIASPSDVVHAKEVIRSVIHEWNAIHSADKKIVLLPVSWESHASPRMGARAQAVINEQTVEICDLLVAVFWTRLGTDTGVAPSGTVEEIRRHMDAGKRVMVYFSKEPAHPDTVDTDQIKAVREFEEECKANGLIHTFESLEEFRGKFSPHLTSTILSAFTELTDTDPIQSSVLPRSSPELSKEAATLLTESSNDSAGAIVRVRTMGGASVETNGKEFIQTRDPRLEATWEGAVEELARIGLIRDVGNKGEVFILTREGFETADLLRQGL